MSQNNLPAQFKAMAVTRFGAPEVLQQITLDMPTISSGEILIKTLAASINPIDYKTRAGLGWAAAQNENNLPFVLGYDCFGEVVGVVDENSPFTVGDKVVAAVGFPLQAGAYGEYVVAHGEDAVKVEANQANEISALPVAGLTAAQGLFEFGQLQANETVLISGAAGAVGYLAVQLALDAGANVIAVANCKDHPLLTKLGNVKLIDYNNLDEFNRLDEVDLWFDLIGGDQALAQLKRVNVVKRLVTVPTITAQAVNDAAVAKGAQAQGMLISPNVEILRNLVAMVENGKLKLNIAKYMNFKLAALAHQQLETGEIKGKVVLEFND